MLTFETFIRHYGLSSDNCEGYTERQIARINRAAYRAAIAAIEDPDDDYAEIAICRSAIEREVARH